MAKGNRAYQRTGIEGEQARSQGQYDTFLNQYLGTGSGGGTGANQRVGGITGRTGTAQSGGKGGAGGGLSQSPLYDDVRAAGARERDYLTSGYRGFAETGGLSPEDIERYRASYKGALGGGPADVNLPDFADERRRLTDFAETGGYTGSDIQRIRAQAASSAPSLFNALKEQQGLAQTRMGGANAGGGAGFDFKSARAAAQQGAKDRLGANIGLSESQRAGRQFGIEGLVGTSTTMGNQALDKAGLINQYNLGAGELTGRAEGDILDMMQRGKETGLSGLKDLYGTNYAPGTEMQNTWLDAIGSSGDATRANRGLNLQNDEINRSRTMENIMGLVGSAAGGITGLQGLFNGGSGGGGGSTGYPVGGVGGWPGYGGTGTGNLYNGGAPITPGTTGAGTTGYNFRPNNRRLNFGQRG